MPVGRRGRTRPTAAACQAWTNIYVLIYHGKSCLTSTWWLAAAGVGAARARPVLRSLLSRRARAATAAAAHVQRVMWQATFAAASADQSHGARIRPRQTQSFPLGFPMRSAVLLLAAMISGGALQAQGPNWFAAERRDALQQPFPSFTAEVEPVLGHAKHTNSVLLALNADTTRHSSRGKTIGLIVGGVAGGVGGALGLRAVCLSTASETNDCTPYAFAGAAIGALVGALLGLAIAGIVAGE